MGYWGSECCKSKATLRRGQESYTPASPACSTCASPGKGNHHASCKFRNLYSNRTSPNPDHLQALLSRKATADSLGDTIEQVVVSPQDSPLHFTHIPSYLEGKVCTRKVHTE